MRRLHVVSMSSGKDSTATALLALATEDRHSLRFVAADTGNEHEVFYEYLDYLERKLSIKIDRIQANFDAEIKHRREYVRDVYPEKLMKEGMTPVQSKEAVSRILDALHPTGNPYLDLCLWKGRFPSRTRQFCTEFLKTKPLAEYNMNLLDDEADEVWSWQGVRIDESEARKKRLQGTGACVKSFNEVGGGLYNYLPILRWKAQDCFDAHRLFGIEPNPLYTQGMGRVGCMPCINSSKDEILEISKRFPAHIERIALWESHVAAISKRVDASFFPDPERDAHLDKRGIYKVVQWSKTSRGGRQYSLFASEPPKVCSSEYGLCE